MLGEINESEYAFMGISQIIPHTPKLKSLLCRTNLDFSNPFIFAALVHINKAVKE